MVPPLTSIGSRAVAGQLAMQPALGERPFALDRRRRFSDRGWALRRQLSTTCHAIKASMEPSGEAVKSARDGYKTVMRRLFGLGQVRGAQQEARAEGKDLA
jgi:hypothetical protein